MKRTKSYIESEQAKKKVGRYQYWNIKDEHGITICSSEEKDNRSFAELLDKIISDNVDAEVQIKYGTNEQSSRNNPPLFIKINEEIEWIEPEEETISINGQPHKVDKNGNVNINFPSPEIIREQPIAEPVRIDYVRQEMEFQLEGIRKEYELKEQKWSAELTNKLAQQTLEFNELILKDKISRLNEREALLLKKEAELKVKEEEIRDNLTGYFKQVPSALGGVLKELISKNEPLSGTEKKEEKPKKEPIRRAVNFSIEEDEETESPKQLNVFEEPNNETNEDEDI